jgi:hypothetical protein
VERTQLIGAARQVLALAPPQQAPSVSQFTRNPAAAFAPPTTGFSNVAQADTAVPAQPGPNIPVQTQTYPEYQPRDPTYGGLTLPGMNARDSLNYLSKRAGEGDLITRGGGQIYRDRADQLMKAIAEDTKYFREGQSALFTKANEGLAAQITSAQKAGELADQKYQNLAIMRDAMDRSPGGITSGPAAGYIVKAKQALANYGLLSPEDLQQLNATEVVSKVGFGLATQVVRSLTARPTQMEVGMALANNPGILLSQPGSKLMLDILMQQTRQEADLARLASNPKNWNNWAETQDNYYKTHPILSPFDRKTPLGMKDFQRVAAEAQGSAPATIPNTKTYTSKDGITYDVINGKLSNPRRQ